MAVKVFKWSTEVVTLLTGALTPIMTVRGMMCIIYVIFMSHEKTLPEPPTPRPQPSQEGLLTRFLHTYFPGKVGVVFFVVAIWVFPKIGGFSPPNHHPFK